MKPFKKHFVIINLFIVFYALLVIAPFGYCCDKISGITDRNCDGRIVISVIGDSLVYGFGDDVNNNQGGYIKRVQDKLPDVVFHNLGVKGLRSKQLLMLLHGIFNQGKKVAWYNALIESDYVFLDYGRNDRWLFGEPIDTYRNIEKAEKRIKEEVSEITAFAPLVIKAVLMLPNRGSQGPWVSDLNKIIMENSTAESPADLRFDLVSKRLLNFDQIHPTSKGYSALSKVFLSYIKKKL